MTIRRRRSPGRQAGAKPADPQPPAWAPVRGCNWSPLYCQLCDRVTGLLTTPQRNGAEPPHSLEWRRSGTEESGVTTVRAEPQRSRLLLVFIGPDTAAGSRPPPGVSRKAPTAVNVCSINKKSPQ